jgi:putative addiction module antidote
VAGILFEDDGVGTIVITSNRELSMTKQTTIRAIGNSAGTTIPKPMLERYHLGEGDTIHLVETEEGILITPFDPDFDEAMEIYAEGASRYRNAMRELAK